jgi:hypothetical protein
LYWNPVMPTCPRQPASVRNFKGMDHRSLAGGIPAIQNN